ncbi:hypothetical protein SLEP1_g22841 [Rubroshorea leprosula]|uniref:Uncharacterized protein n=1 Tax=Rubroshorea leprosula TaxID=152421 RepID=A0AAV5JJ92_9ROSI|nr:hypothetical protein SLEP1_g22841 [Rubroshorea leprosula]
MTKPFKSEACKFGTSSASKQIKFKASMPHKAKMLKETKEKTSVCIDELSMHSQYKLSIIIDLIKKSLYVSHCLYVQAPSSSEGLRPILILGNDEVSSKAKEAKNVKALMKNMDEGFSEEHGEDSDKRT